VIVVLVVHSLGIGGCWIGLALGFGEDKECLKEAGVPEGHKLVAQIIFRYSVKCE
jgi:nitroreductase